MTNNVEYPPLTAYLVIYSDGERRPTAMAAGITLEQARDYFVGKKFTNRDEVTSRTCTAVEELTETA
jgi:hypothetical protein